MFQPSLFRCLVICLTLTSCSVSAHAAGTEPQTPLPKGAVGRLACREREYFNWVAFSDDGKLAATPHRQYLRLWQVATGKQLWRTPCREQGAVIFSRDGKVLIHADLDGITTCDVGTGKKLRRIAPPVKGLERFVVRHPLAFSPDSKTFATIQLSAIQLWDWPSGKELRRLEATPEDHVLMPGEFSPDGRIVTGAGRRGHVRLWDVASGHLFQTVTPCVGRVYGMSFSPDGRLLHYTYLKPLPGTTAEPLPGMPLPPPIAKPRPGMPPLPGFPPGGPVCVNVIEACELASGRVILHIEQKECSRAVLLTSPDRRLLVMLDRQDELSCEIPFWDARTGKLVRRLKTRGWPLRFSPDGKLLATYTPTKNGTNEILFWDVSRIRAPEPKATPLPPAALSRLWDDLASKDITVARRAVWTLVAIPGQAVPLLRDRLKPVVVKNAKHLAALIRNLDSNDFAVRQKAIVALEDEGYAAASALRAALATDPPVEVRTRIERLLERLGPPFPIRSPRVLRTIRAQEVLEYAGTAEAQKILRRMAAGAPGAPETEDAKAALARLARRAAKP